MTNKPTEAVIEAIRGALSWIEMPFVTAETPADELRNRISFCLADAERAIEALLASTPQKPDHLRTVFEAALTLCHNATDECRDDQQVLVPGDDLQALNDALTVVEEADADREEAIPQEPARCPTCNVQDPLLSEYCSDGFHAPGETYWPEVAQEPDDDAEWLRAERLLASIWYYGEFAAETHNERLLQQHMERVGLWPIDSEADLFAKLDRLQAKAPETDHDGIVVVDEADFTRGEE